MAARLAPYVDRVVTGDEPDLIHLTNPAIAHATAALTDPTRTVLATPGVLVTAGPGWFQRVIEAVTPTAPPTGLRNVPSTRGAGQDGGGACLPGLAWSVPGWAPP